MKKNDTNFAKFYPNYNEWLKKKKITEDDAYLLMHGVNPNDYKKYLEDDSDMSILFRTVN